LSDLALEWMVHEATAVPEPLPVDSTRLDLSPSHRGMQHDGRVGWGVLWLRGTRDRLRLEPLQCETRVEKRFLEVAVPTARVPCQGPSADRRARISSARRLWPSSPSARR
jgi:hypothetical protein